MPRKFQRESALDAARSKYGAVFDSPVRVRLNARQRLLLIYIGIFTFSLFLLVFYVFQRSTGLGSGDLILPAAGTIVEKRVESGDGEETCLFVIDVILPDGPARAVAGVTRARYDALAVGDLVGVRYRREPDGGIRIVQTGAVALPKTIQ